MSKRLVLNLQNVCADAKLPPRPVIFRALRAALNWDDLSKNQRGAIITVRFVEASESLALNHAFRGKNKATNVLSFPYEETPLVVGDLVLCPAVIAQEAEEQGKEVFAHDTHLLVHGTLHLQGFDHEHAADANLMEEKEREILAFLGLPDPYAER